MQYSVEIERIHRNQDKECNKRKISLNLLEVSAEAWEVGLEEAWAGDKGSEKLM